MLDPRRFQRFVAVLAVAAALIMVGHMAGIW
jgi:hypothetical protein